jgi:hypothetical protein
MVNVKADSHLDSLDWGRGCAATMLIGDSLGMLCFLLIV